MRRQTCIANRVLSVNRLVAICAAVLVAGAQSAWGSPILSWSFDETEFSIRHGDRRPIVVNATLRSDPLSDAVLITGVGASETGDLQKSFHFQFGALIPRPLAVLPGTHIHFVWGSLTPLGTPAPGQYRWGLPRPAARGRRVRAVRCRQPVHGDRGRTTSGCADWYRCHCGHQHGPRRLAPASPFSTAAGVPVRAFV
jgi:hypothetical protein